MNFHDTRILALGALGLAFAAGVPHAAADDASRPAALGAVDGSRDSDGFSALRTRVGGLAFENALRYSGVAVQSTRYEAPGLRKDVAGVVGLYRDQRRATLEGVEIEAGVARVSGRLRAIGDATWRTRPWTATALDVIGSADLVETPKALERGIGYGFLALALERELSSRFTATVLAGHQPFTDGNARTHLRGRLIWLANEEHGVTLQLRYRQYDTRQLDVAGAYFNPETYRRLLGVVAIRKRHAGWMLSGALGAGEERIAGAGSKPAYLAEARAEGPLGDSGARLVLRAGYLRAAGFADDPDYAYRSFGATVIVPF